MKLKEFYTFLMLIENDMMMADDTEIFVRIDTEDGPLFLEPTKLHSYHTGRTNGQRDTPRAVIYAYDRTTP